MFRKLRIGRHLIRRHHLALNQITACLSMLLWSPSRWCTLKHYYSSPLVSRHRTRVTKREFLRDKKWNNLVSLCYVTTSIYRHMCDDCITNNDNIVLFSNITCDQVFLEASLPLKNPGFAGVGWWKCVTSFGTSIWGEKITIFLLSLCLVELTQNYKWHNKFHLPNWIKLACFSF